MNFEDCIAKERDDEFGEKTCWRLEITSPPEQLILHSWRVENGKVKYPWFYSVAAKDLDPQSITIQEPYEENELYYLRVNCIFYKDVITEKREYNPSFLHRYVVMHFPISKEISDVEATKRSLADLLMRCGARPSVINAEAIEEILVPLQKTIESAHFPIKWAKDKKPTFNQTVEVESRRMLLIQKMHRIKKFPLYKIPFQFWKLRKFLFPEIELHTFELLSLDTTEMDVRLVPDQTNVWMTSLYSVERLDTTMVSKIPPTKGYQMWYTKVLFPTETEAKNFSIACASSVEQIRDRLYQLHQKTG
jgi:hypothetical protein